MIKACSLASGSNGNCYFIKAGKKSFLVDCGISFLQLRKRLNDTGHDLEDISAVFITHEHTDHIKGLERLSSLTTVPIYMTLKTSKSLPYLKNPRIIRSNDTVEIGEIKVRSHPKCHDALDPCSYSFLYKKKKVSVMTDFGSVCSNVIESIKGSNILFIETNYDNYLLANGSYPKILKERIMQAKGHISNYDAGLLVLEHGSKDLKYVFLSHLSENNNDPKLALDTFTSIISERRDLNPETILTSRKTISRLVSF